MCVFCFCRDVKLTDVDKVMRVNFFSHVTCLSAALPYLTKGSHVAVTTSTAGKADLKEGKQGELQQ